MCVKRDEGGGGRGIKDREEGRERRMGTYVTGVNVVVFQVKHRSHGLSPYQTHTCTHTHTHLHTALHSRGGGVVQTGAVVVVGGVHIGLLILAPVQTCSGPAQDHLKRYTHAHTQNK